MKPLFIWTFRKKPNPVCTYLLLLQYRLQYDEYQVPILQAVVRKVGDGTLRAELQFGPQFPEKTMDAKHLHCQLQVRGDSVVAQPERLHHPLPGLTIR